MYIGFEDIVEGVPSLSLYEHEEVRYETPSIASIRYLLEFDMYETGIIRDVSTLNTTGKFTKKQFVKTNGLSFRSKQILDGTNILQSGLPLSST